MTYLKIKKVGNAYVIDLPKDVLAQLKVGEGDNLLLTPTDNGFEMTAADEKLEQVMKAAHKCMDKYDNTLKVLAK